MLYKSISHYGVVGIHLPAGWLWDTGDKALAPPGLPVSPSRGIFCASPGRSAKHHPTTDPAGRHGGSYAGVAAVVLVEVGWEKVCFFCDGCG